MTVWVNSRSKYHRIVRKICEVYHCCLLTGILVRSSHTSSTLLSSKNVLVLYFPNHRWSDVVDRVILGWWVLTHCLAIHTSPHWHCTARNAFEKDLLYRYLRQLWGLGGVGYRTVQCWFGYRLGVILWLNRRIKGEGSRVYRRIMDL